MRVKSLDGKIRPVIRGAILHYILDLGETGLFGHNPSEVARELILESIRRHLEGGMIKPRRFTDRPGECDGRD